MPTDVTRVFYFNGDANALGGYAHRPFRFIPTPTSVALSPTGGSIVTRAHEYEFENLIRCHASHTHVSGWPEGKNGPWRAKVKAVVEGLDILGRIKADRLVAHAHLYHPGLGATSDMPTVSFGGSAFENLSVDGVPQKPVINQTLLPLSNDTRDHKDENHTDTPGLTWSTIRGVARKQSQALVGTEGVPQSLVDRFGWQAQPDGSRADEEQGYAICSLVDKIEGASAGQSFGHVIDLQEAGKIYLGEILIYRGAVLLSMVRAEMGSDTEGEERDYAAAPGGTTGSGTGNGGNGNTNSGQVSAASVRGNGVTHPPN